MTKRFLLVAGNIGVGKTSLTDRLAARLGWQAAYESVADNPYLADLWLGPELAARVYGPLPDILTIRSEAETHGC